jgi:hypothetical protein
MATEEPAGRKPIMAGNWKSSNTILRGAASYRPVL